MNIPLWILVYLPKETQEREIQRRWEKKPDTAILESYVDANEWIRLSKGMFASETMEGIANQYNERLEKYIMPQMRKRDLFD